MDGATIETKGSVTEISVSINRALDDMTPVMAEIVLTMKNQVARTFDRQASPVTGAPWAPLSGLTLANRFASGSKPLRDTQRLFNSLIAANPVVTPDSAKIETNLEYARIHQDGGVIEPKTAKYLAIPISKEAKRAGSARRFFSSKKPIFRGRVMGLLNGKKQFVGHFILKDSVRIPARPYLGWSEEYANEIREVFADGVMQQIQIEDARRR